MTTQPTESPATGLTAIRAGLHATLAGLEDTLGVVHDGKPDRWTTPCVMLLPADPWIAILDGLAHGAYGVSYQVLLILSSGPSDVVIGQAEDAVDAVLDALDASTHSWLVDSVSAPDVIEYEGLGPHLTVRILVTLPTQI